jgi:hypothetical protein
LAAGLANLTIVSSLPRRRRLLFWATGRLIAAPSLKITEFSAAALLVTPTSVTAFSVTAFSVTAFSGTAFSTSAPSISRSLARRKMLLKSRRKS